MRSPLRKICVYCGSTTGSNPAYIEAAKRLGYSIAQAGLGMVYGGGQSGLMGVVAWAVREKGGHITGIIPASLVENEQVFFDADEYHEVNSFHERKMLMYQLSDAFIALPGGPGTLEELIEQMAWSQLGLHNKPIFVINTKGFWNPLSEFLKIAAKVPGAGTEHKRECEFMDDPESAVESFLKK
ncbi:MAG: TIGR00730 family Rossman fold protein [Azospira oryzae]|nr:MAG: TIGR00730 family Rossman fold protein [Azospira oryzae]